MNGLSQLDKPSSCFRFGKAWLAAAVAKAVWQALGLSRAVRQIAR